MIALTPESLKLDSQIPTLGQVPFLLGRLGERLHKRGLLDNAKFKVWKPGKLKPESES